MHATRLVGDSAAVQSLREDIEFVARCDAKVLITGESGTGKEVVARLIHEQSRRRNSPLVTVNCAALTESLLETELFGHVRGSFTDAHRDRTGALEQSNHGTVFLDEIGETTPRMQSLLLRFLETGEIQRVGSERIETRVDVRVIAATNRVLLDDIAAKSFREDLYYRLNVIHLQVSPLRERPQDIAVLLDYFLGLFAQQYGTVPRRVPGDVLEVLARHTWPGNVRELRNLAERLVIHTGQRQIKISDLQIESSSPRPIPIPGLSLAAAPAFRDVLWDRLTKEKQSFWSVVYGPFMSRDLTREDLRELVRRALEQTSGNYRLVVQLFNMPAEDYKRFLAFLRKYNCQMPFQPFRSVRTGEVRPGSAHKPPVAARA